MQFHNITVNIISNVAVFDNLKYNYCQCNNTQSYTKTETFTKTKYKRLSLLIPNADNNVIPYSITPFFVGSQKPITCKRTSDALKYTSFTAVTVTDKLKQTRLLSGISQKEMSTILNVNRSLLNHYENGKIKEELMDTELLKKYARACGKDEQYFLTDYHKFKYISNVVIKDFCTSKGFTKRNLANYCNVSLNTVKRWFKHSTIPCKDNYEKYFKIK